MSLLLKFFKALWEPLRSSYLSLNMMKRVNPRSLEWLPPTRFYLTNAVNQISFHLCLITVAKEWHRLDKLWILTCVSCKAHLLPWWLDSKEDTAWIRRIWNSLEANSSSISLPTNYHKSWDKVWAKSFLLLPLILQEKVPWVKIRKNPTKFQLHQMAGQLVMLMRSSPEKLLLKNGLILTNS
jgi:hypothetical protein